MIKSIVMALFLMLSCSSVQAGLPTMENIKDVPRKIYDTSWMKDKLIKNGLFISMAIAQSTTGMTEGYHFREGGGGTYIVNADNYHAFETLKRASWVATGWFAYADIRSDRRGKAEKIENFIGDLLITRDIWEWSYKYQRYHNPFDYSVERNRHAVYYIGINNWKINDLYFGTGPNNGAAVDIAFLGTGILMRSGFFTHTISGLWGRIF